MLQHLQSFHDMCLGRAKELLRPFSKQEGCSAAVDEIVTHMLKYSSTADLTAAKSALLSIANSEDIKPFIDKIPGAPDPVKVVFMEVLAEKGSPEFFGTLMTNARSESRDVSYAARRGFLRPVGEWNEQEVIVDGTKIKIVLNGTTIVDGDIADSIKNGTLDGLDHPGLKRKTGHIGFLGHGSVLWFRNIRIKGLDSE